MLDHAATPNPTSASRTLENPAFRRVVQNIPDDVLSTFGPEQLSAIETALRYQGARHSIDFRASIPWFGNRNYVVFLFGRDTRSIERLRRDGQLAFGRIAVTFGFLVVFIVGAMMLSAGLLVYSFGKLVEDDYRADSRTIFVHSKNR